MTVKVSSSVGETMLYTADRQTAKSDSQDSNWDINDPDIPARIDQYVSIRTTEGFVRRVFEDCEHEDIV